tara:strand:- start:125 stop:385 length:261 start_codon:yes stop_codon:yes gene_type:complete
LSLFSGGKKMIDQEILLAAMPGGWEMVVIALVILLMFGAKKLPELARGLGQGIREFKGAVDGVKDELKDAEESIEKNDEPDQSSNN